MKKSVLIATPSQDLAASLEKAVKSLGFHTTTLASSREFDGFTGTVDIYIVDEDFTPTEGIVICTQDKADYYRHQNMIPLVNPFTPADLSRVLGLKVASCIIGESSTIIALKKMVAKLAPHSIPVYINGETGSGKELVATDLHNLSCRQGEFVKINCAGFTPELLNSELFGHIKGAFTGADRTKVGLVELANGGTLFLDEVGDMPMQCQAQLLRVLENGTYFKVGETRAQYTSARIVCATHHSLRQLVSEKKFREDLFYRLNGYTVKVPPLRSRTEDIPLLIKTFLPEVKFTAKAVDYLTGLNWNGNVRELKQVCQRIAIFKEEEEVSVKLVNDMLNESDAIHTAEVGETSGGDTSEKESFILKFDSIPDKNTVMEQFKNQFIMQYITALHLVCNGNLSEMQKMSKIARPTLTNYMQGIPNE